MTRKLLCTLMLVSGVTLFSTLPMMAQDASSPQPVVGHAITFAVSQPLRELAELPQPPQYGFHEVNPIRRIPMKDFGYAVDPVEQSAAGPAANYSIALDFLGVGHGFPYYSVSVAPPGSGRTTC